MPIIPDSKVAQVQFCELHFPVWLTNAAAIGLTSAQANSFKTLAQAARAAYDAAQNAKLAAKAAVTAQDNAIRMAVGNAADLIRVIKGFAELTGTPDAVYSLAQIPPPATPTPVPAPGKPTNVAVTLEPTGAVTFTWEATNSAVSGGASFTVSRRLPGQSAFSFLGTAPGSTAAARRMTFTDTTIPTSAAGVGAQYIIQGFRGAVGGEPSDAVVVHFGVGGGESAEGGGGGLQLAA